MPCGGRGRRDAPGRLRVRRGRRPDRVALGDTWDAGADGVALRVRRRCRSGTAFAGMRRVVEVMFKAACPECRAGFELTPGALRLAIGASSRTTFYSFTCPECGVRRAQARGGTHRRTAHRGGVAAHCVCTPPPSPPRVRCLGSCHDLAHARYRPRFRWESRCSECSASVFSWKRQRLGRRVARLRAADRQGVRGSGAGGGRDARPHARDGCGDDSFP